MRGLVLVALLLCGCRQLLGLDDVPVDGSQHTDAGGDTTDGIVPLPDDRDGDHVADEVDNCPDTPNTDQANEDGDALGDACDPCPIDVDNTDTDGDGVGDKCDPHPGAIGDKILVFEGFKNGVPAAWAIGFAPTPSTDDAIMPIVANNHTAIVPPNGGLANGTLSASLTIDQIGGANSCAQPPDPMSAICSNTSISLPYDVSADTGIYCDLDSDSAQSPNKIVDLYDEYKLPNNPYLQQGNYGWNTGLYTFMLQRTGNNYNCTVTPAGGAAHTANGSTGDANGQTDPHAALWMFNVQVHVHWMMFVKGP